MKVRCRQFADWKGQPAEYSKWLEVGVEYIVLSVFVELQPTPQILIRIQGNSSTPALFNLQDFDIVTNLIPPSWVIYAPTVYTVGLAPKAWTGPHFWVRFFDGDPEATMSFEREKRLIVAAEEQGTSPN